MSTYGAGTYGAAAGTYANLIGDVIVPIAEIVSGPTRSKISAVPTVDSSDLTFESNEDFQAYQIRVVPLISSPVSAGALIESGSSGVAGQDVTVTVTDDELIAAGGVEGDNIIKVFVQDQAGNWST